MRFQRTFTTIVGAQGMGKSQFAKNTLYRQKQPCLIYDNPGDDTFISFPIIRDIKHYAGPVGLLKRERIREGIFVGYTEGKGVEAQGIVTAVSSGQVELMDYLSGAVRSFPLNGSGTFYQDKFRVSYQVEYDDFWRLIKDRVRNCFIAVTDATSLESNRPTKGLKDVMYELRHYGLDVMLLFHNNFRIPLEIIENTHVLVKFREGAPLAVKRYEERFFGNKLDRLLALWEAVENHPRDSELDQYFCMALMLKETKDVYKKR